ncbi:Hypothetical predicted protein [Xyrichtys novacula]|uniref:Uncharacterized protein n=1 Tax=Xyrichtys novacula TaxID=13765 RepID=A0AAV1HIY9_XYRNO|nr:Hypothetical predicted protein [Xyrichtys novacula]
MGRFLHLTSVFIVETPRHSPLGCRPVCGLARGREHIGCLSKNRRRERQRDRDRNTNRQRRKQEYLQRNQRRNSRSWSPDEDDDTTAHPPRLELVIQMTEALQRPRLSWLSDPFNLPVWPENEPRD